MGKRSRSKYSGGPNKIKDQFSAYPVEMLMSPTWRAITPSAKRCIERIAIELAKHGGRDNGELPVTYRDFVAHGVPKARIKPALAEAVALGFIEMTPGHASLNKDYGRAARFRIMFLNCIGGPSPDHTRWRRFKTYDEAKLTGKLARAGAMQKRHRKAKANASSYGSQGEPLASGAQGEPLGKVRKVNHYPSAQGEPLSTVSATGRSQPPHAEASEAPPATQASRRARPERSGAPAAAVQPDADEAGPTPWTDQPPEPTP